MKFRAAVTNVKHFYQVAQSIEKVAKKCIIRLSPASIEIICPNGNEEGVQVWSKINQEDLFSDYRVQSNAADTICAEIATDALVQVLRDLASSGKVETRETVMKLAKKGTDAVFTFETRDHDQTWAKGLTVSHSVRVQMIRPVEMEKVKEPLCPDPDVHIVTPPLKEMRVVLDRLKAYSSKIRFSANNSGELTLSAETDDGEELKTTWTDLVHPTIEAGEDAPPREAPDLGQHFGALMSAASLLKFMNTAVITPTTCIACICENHCLIMYVYIGEVLEQNGILTFYLPARLTGDED
ncbi:cell cycle checkpoint [Calocera viscosa TUFC12733]|uniref:Checkpoint protein n=1 Tax=Calocera viscosa (strain TUFC12733) TaxID=1330018 RepID=A0A167R2N1_CALVF|nr:cell cycle checkpoint [Calocera viscosa TUFC12733]